MGFEWCYFIIIIIIIIIFFLVYHMIPKNQCGNLQDAMVFFGVQVGHFVNVKKTTRGENGPRNS